MTDVQTFMQEETTAEPELQDELVKATKILPKKGESAKNYTLRVANKAHSKFTDDQWEALSEEAQLWVNNNIEARDGVEGKSFCFLTVPEAPEAVAEAEAQDEPEKKKKAAPKKEGNGEHSETNGSRGRKPQYARDAKIKILVSENPHREGTKCANMFAKYKDGMTVGEVLDAGVPYSNVRYLKGLGHITIS